MKKRNLIITAVILIAAGIVLIRAAMWWPPQKTAAPIQAAADTSKAPYFLFISDIHLNTSDSATDYGDDTGLRLWQAFLQKASALVKSKNPPAFIVYTGDLPAHYSCTTGCYLTPGSSSRKLHDSNLTVILTGIRSLVAGTHIPFFYAPGNNDALDGDYYSFADEQQHTPLTLVPENVNPYPALNTASGAAAQPPCMLANPRPAMGWYSASPMKGLRLIALNSVILGRKYTAADGVSQLQAGNEEMQWLETQLADAKAKNEKVYIAMHIPPGTDAYSGKPMWAPLPSPETCWLNSFIGMCTRYQGNIAAVLYGHTHMDELRRIYDSTGSRMVAAAISCPGITPQHANNPGFKKVYFNSKDFRPVDFVTLCTTPGARAWGDSLYSFSAVYHAARGADIFETVKTQSLDTLNKEMDAIYTVRHGAPGYATASGIEVMPVK